MCYFDNWLSHLSSKLYAKSKHPFKLKEFTPLFVICDG